MGNVTSGCVAAKRTVAGADDEFVTPASDTKVILSEAQDDFFSTRNTFVFPEQRLSPCTSEASMRGTFLQPSMHTKMGCSRHVAIVMGLNYAGTSYALQAGERDADCIAEYLEKHSFEVRRGTGSTVNFFAILDECAKDITTGRISRDATLCIVFCGQTVEGEALIFTDALVSEADIRLALARPMFAQVKVTLILDTWLVWNRLPHETQWPESWKARCSSTGTKRCVPRSQVHLRSLCTSIFTHTPTAVDITVLVPQNDAHGSHGATECMARNNQIHGVFSFALCIVLHNMLRDSTLSYESFVTALRAELWNDPQPILVMSDAGTLSKPAMNITGGSICDVSTSSSSHFPDSQREQGWDRRRAVPSPCRDNHFGVRTESSLNFGTRTESNLQLGARMDTGMHLGARPETGLHLGARPETGLQLGARTESGLRIGGRSDNHNFARSDTDHLFPPCKAPPSMSYNDLPPPPPRVTYLDHHI